MDPSPSSSQPPSPASAPAKIFVGGITKELEEGALREYFEKYGDVKEIAVVKERATGNLKGYGFIEFFDAEAAERAINDEGPHLIRDRSVEVKRAISRSLQSTTNNTNNNNNIPSKKIFVGGLPSNLTEYEFKLYFSKFGSINDVVIMNDSETRRPRGFGFITFDSEEAAKNALQKRFHELNNKNVEVKIAIPKDNNPQICCDNYYPPLYGAEYGNYYNGFECQFLPGFGFGPVGCFNYSVVNYVAPMIRWNEEALMTVRQNLVPFFEAGFYNGGGNMVEMDNGGYYEGELNENGKSRLEVIEIGNRGYLELQSFGVDDAE